jgi:polyisoprenoid-binding protein YceI
MATHKIGPETGSLVLRTTRQGLAAQAGHDLTIEVMRWSGTVTTGDEPTDTRLELTADLDSLRVQSGSGGVKPLSERAKRDIANNAKKTLQADRYPELRYVSEQVTATGDVAGKCTLHGTERPVRVEVTSLGDDKYRATGTIVQSQFGIKPYTGMFGALKVADEVSFEADADLSRASD